MTWLNRLTVLLQESRSEFFCPNRCVDCFGTGLLYQLLSFSEKNNKKNWRRPSSFLSDLTSYYLSSFIPISFAWLLPSLSSSAFLAVVKVASKALHSILSWAFSSTSFQHDPFCLSLTPVPFPMSPLAYLCSFHLVGSILRHGRLCLSLASLVHGRCIDNDSSGSRHILCCIALCNNSSFCIVSGSGFQRLP